MNFHAGFRYHRLYTTDPIFIRHLPKAKKPPT